MELSAFIQAVQANQGRVEMPSGNKYAMRQGEDPASFYMRVTEAEHARQTIKEATLPSKGAGGQDTGGESGQDTGDESDGAGDAHSAGRVQGPQASLAETIESQVVALRRSSTALKDQIARATAQLRRDKEDLRDVNRELKLAEKFLRTLSSEVRKPSGADIRSEEGEESDGSS